MCSKGAWKRSGRGCTSLLSEEDTSAFARVAEVAVPERDAALATARDGALDDVAARGAVAGSRGAGLGGYEGADPRVVEAKEGCGGRGRDRGFGSWAVRVGEAHDLLAGVVGVLGSKDAAHGACSVRGSDDGDCGVVRATTREHTAHERRQHAPAARHDLARVRELLAGCARVKRREHALCTPPRPVVQALPVCKRCGRFDFFFWCWRCCCCWRRRCGCCCWRWWRR